MIEIVGLAAVFLVAFFGLSGALQTLCGLLPSLFGLPPQISAFAGAILAWAIIGSVWSIALSAAVPVSAYVAGFAALAISVGSSWSDLTPMARQTLIAEMWGLIVAAIFI